jgi:hypothetical protein
MKRVVLFRFHQNREVCLNRLDLLRRYNPGVEIHGMYGGDEAAFPRVERGIGGELSSLFCLSGRSVSTSSGAVWCWRRTPGTPSSC